MGHPKKAKDQQPSNDPPSIMRQMASASPVQRMELYQVVEGAQAELAITNVGDLLKLFRLLVEHMPDILAAGEQIQQWIAKLVELWNSVGADAVTPPQR